jgi:phage terminase large subunit-like protein
LSRPDPVTAYARSVVAGELVTGKLVRQACERHLRDLEDGPARSLVWNPVPLDPETGEEGTPPADHAIEFFGYLKHSKGEWAGQAFELSLWQKFIIGSVFGWMRADGTRRFQTAYVEVARKNGKSTMLAGVGLYLFVADGEAGAEVYSSATKKDQAKIVWGEAERMVKASPSLRSRVGCHRNNLHIVGTASKFEPLGADSTTLDGLNAHGNIVDELHAHRDRGVWDVLVTSMGARRQPLTFAITTAGTYDPESIGWELHDHAVKVTEGALEDDSFFAYVAAIDDEDEEWSDPEIWIKANPNLAVSVKPEYMARMCQDALNKPSFTNTFLRLHLDRWTQQVKRWISMEKWNAIKSIVDATALRGRACWGGLDLAQKLDIAAFVLAFPRDDGGLDLLPRFWCPEATVMERSKKDRVPYDAWVRDGYLIATPGEVIDYDFIQAEIKELGEQYGIQEIAFDPWAALQLATKLGETDGFTMVATRQGYQTLSEPSKEFERQVVAGKLGHGDNPILRWMASNVAKTEDPAGNIKPDKSKSREKIDGIVAAIMAIGRASLHTQAKEPPYETRGIRFI